MKAAGTMVCGPVMVAAAGLLQSMYTFHMYRLYHSDRMMPAGPVAGGRSQLSTSAGSGDG